MERRDSTQEPNEKTKAFDRKLGWFNSDFNTINKVEMRLILLAIQSNDRSRN